LREQQAKAGDIVLLYGGWRDHTLHVADDDTGGGDP
jgi:hypothetical protein